MPCFSNYGTPTEPLSNVTAPRLPRTITPSTNNNVATEDDLPLEFDNDGRSAPSSSAKGVCIKYARQIKDHHCHKIGQKVSTLSALKDLDIDARREKDGLTVPVIPLVGVASTSVDWFMGTYIRMEEQSMGNMMVESNNDQTVDTRG